MYSNKNNNKNREELFKDFFRSDDDLQPKGAQHERVQPEQPQSEQPQSEQRQHIRPQPKHLLPKALGTRPLITLALLAVGLFVIVFAFIMEARANRLAAIPEPGTHSHFSAIQEEIDTLDWIEQMPLTINPYSRPSFPLEAVNGIVIHYIGNPATTALQNRNFFENLATSHERHASSNFIIGLDGEIIQCIPVDEVAYASTERNKDTLSIEICHPDETGIFTKESLEAAVRLTAWLCSRLGLTAGDVIRHYDIQGKECPLYFVENPDEWAAFKSDITKEMADLQSTDGS